MLGSPQLYAAASHARGVYRRRVSPSLPARTITFDHVPDSRASSPYKFIVNQDNELERLGERHQPTKRNHDYLPYYWMHLRDIRMDVTNMLEIGVQTDRSLRMWEEFFPNAMIHGLDIDPACQQFQGGRRVMHIGDQGDPTMNPSSPTAPPVSSTT